MSITDGAFEMVCFLRYLTNSMGDRMSVKFWKKFSEFVGEK